MAEGASDIEYDNPRRRRGTRFSIGEPGASNDRSAGSPPNQGAETTAEFETSIPVTPTKRGRKSKANATAAKGAADMMIGCMESLAYARYRRPDARMTPDERNMALEGLAESVKVLPSDVVDQISSLSAPVMACMGFALYAVRLGEMESAHRANKRDNAISRNVDEILAQQPQQEYVPDQTGANGFGIPSKDFISSLQERT